MSKLKKNNLFIEINNDKFLIAVGKYDDELNFEIIEKETINQVIYKNKKIENLDLVVNNFKKKINDIEKKLNVFFSDVNIIISKSDVDCINVSGFKKLNGNQILSEDISYILNDVKLKLSESEKDKTIIHLFNTKYILDNKILKNLPIGLYGDFYSHQLTFFMVEDKEIENLKTIFNKCNLNLNKVILKSFTEGIKTIKKYREDTFVEIIIYKEETHIVFFYESAFCFYQKFNFGSEIILKDISKICSLEILIIRNIISDLNYEKLSQDIYLDEKYFEKKNFKKISHQYLKEIASARIEEIANIIFNQNKNLNNFQLKKTNLYLNLEDKNIGLKFKDVFENNFKEFTLNFDSSKDDNTYTSLEIFGELLSKGWAKEAIPVINKKKSWITRVFSGLFE
tara:strand:- start:152 stop:1342 length:1191 start_codon:yes stop_codon:yes gene_type:complete